jgi:acyl-CoA thioesterase I
MIGKLVLSMLLVALMQGSTTVKTILFYGDSLTAGYGLSADEAFPALIDKKLKQQGKNWKAVNGGLSGETSAGGLSRIDWMLRQPVDIFVLELGGNDGLRGLPLEQTTSNLQGIIDKVKAKNPT